MEAYETGVIGKEEEIEKLVERMIERRYARLQLSRGAYPCCEPCHGFHYDLIVRKEDDVFYIRKTAFHSSEPEYKIRDPQRIVEIAKAWFKLYNTKKYKLSLY